MVSLPVDTVSYASNEEIEVSEMVGSSAPITHSVFHSVTNVGGNSHTSTIAMSSPNQQKNGVVVYNIPKEMKVRETYQVTVRIGMSSIEITQSLGNEVKIASIPITETMEVKLVDPSPADYKVFEIVADNSGIQMVDSTGSYTQWSWNVTPVKVGKANLKIVISIIRNGNKKEQVHEDNVIVNSTPISQIEFFFHKYWQWLFVTLLIPIFKYFWGVWKKKKEAEENKPKKKQAKKK